MIVDTNGELFPEGDYTFRVSEVPEEILTKGGYKGWQFHFETEIEGIPAHYSERFMVWLLAPVLRGLGFEEIKPGKFEFEPAMALGRTVRVSIIHEKAEKGANAGQVFARMRNIQLSSQSSAQSQAALKTQTPATEDIPF